MDVRITPAPVLIALLAAACGVQQDPAQAGHPAGRNDVVLQVRTTGGFVSPAIALSSPPQFTLYGDGTVVVPHGAGLGMFRLDSPEVRRLLEQARELLDADAGTANPAADMPTTTVVMYAGGRYDRVSGTGETVRRFADRLPSRSARLVTPTALAVYAAPFQGAAEGAAAIWPLDPTQLEGHPVAGVPYRCAGITGADVSTLLASFQHATPRTPWLLRAGGAPLQLIVRPALRTDAPCASP